MDRDDSAKDRLKIPSILNSHCPMRIATNSIYLCKVGFYPKKFNKIVQSMRKSHKKTSKKEVIFPNFSLSQNRQSLKSQSGRQDSNLRPSAPKALNRSSAALGLNHS